MRGPPTRNGSGSASSPGFEPSFSELHWVISLSQNDIHLIRNEANLTIFYSNTGEPFHNFNMWQDTRTKTEVKQWNNSITLKALNKASGLLHSITGSQRFKAGYALKFLINSVSWDDFVYLFKLSWNVSVGPNSQNFVPKNLFMYLFFVLHEYQIYLTNLLSLGLVGMVGASLPVNYVWEEVTVASQHNQSLPILG